MVELNEILNLKFYKGEDLYSDGDVEDEILKICKSGQDIQELLQFCSNFFNTAPMTFIVSQKIT